MKKYFYYSATIMVAALLVLSLFKFGVVEKADKIHSTRIKQPQEEPVEKEPTGQTLEISPPVQEETQKVPPPKQPSEISDETTETEERTQPLLPEKPVKSFDISVFKAVLLKTVAKGSEEQVNKYLDELSGEGKITSSHKERFSQMVFWRNFVSLQENPSCKALDKATKLFELEKELKSTWFTTQGMGFIMSKEITAAEKKWHELTTACKNGAENDH